MQPGDKCAPRRYRWMIPAALAIVAVCSARVQAQNELQPIDPQSMPLDLVVEPGADPGMIVDAAPTSLTLQTLESFALMSNPSIARAAALVSAARARALQVGLQANPQVGIDFQQLGSDGLAEQYGVLIGQEIVRRQKLQLDRSIALQEARQLEQELAAQRERVLTDVRIAYIRALRAERQIELTKQLVEIGEQGVNVTNELLRAKEVGRTDILQAELEVESASILLRNAINQRVAVWQQLSAVTGQTPLEPQSLVGDISENVEEIQFEQTLSQLQSQSPEVAAAFASIQRARFNLQRQQIQNRPNVFVQGLINWQDNGIQGRSDGALTVTLPLPLWNRNQGGIREARSQLVASERELAQTELGLKNRLAPVYERYLNAKEQVERYRDRILPKAAETLALTRETYELGEINYVNLLTVQRTYAQNQIAYLDSLEALRIAQAEIRGLLLFGSLETR